MRCMADKSTRDSRSRGYSPPHHCRVNVVPHFPMPVVVGVLNKAISATLRSELLCPVRENTGIVGLAYTLCMYKSICKGRRMLHSSSLTFVETSASHDLLLYAILYRALFVCRFAVVCCERTARGRRQVRLEVRCWMGRRYTPFGRVRDHYRRLQRYDQRCAYRGTWSPIVLPVPIAHRHAVSQKRTVGGVYICTDTDWKGTCGYAVQPLNTCIRMGQAWAFQISSFGPDKCTTCLAWP